MQINLFRGNGAGFRTCREGEFLCDGRRCLDIRRRCNGFQECLDGTDELNCGRCQKCRLPVSVKYFVKLLVYLGF